MYRYQILWYQQMNCNLYVCEVEQDLIHHEGELGCVLAEGSVKKTISITRCTYKNTNPPHPQPPTERGGALTCSAPTEGGGVMMFGDFMQ